MRKYLFFVINFILSSCANDNAPDCVQTSGPYVIEEHMLDDFERILVNENIELTIIQDSEFQIKIETGEHLISDVNYTIENGLLTLTDHNQCNWVRQYVPTKIIVTTPNLTEMRSNSQYSIKFQGIITFPDLKLISENFNTNSIASGDFELKIQNQSLSIVSNNTSQFHITGSTEFLFVGFYAGTTGFFGANLEATHINVYQRSSHDMIVYPKESLSGELRSTGNLISVQSPDEVDVQEYYTGKLIFLN